MQLIHSSRDQRQKGDLFNQYKSKQFPNLLKLPGSSLYIDKFLLPQTYLFISHIH